MDKRTKLAAKNIGVGLLAKGASILLSFLCVPVTLGYLNDYEYGIWLTMNSILSWVYLADIGIGNGLRNKLAEAIAQKDKLASKGLISTAFISLTAIMISVFLLFLVCQPLINWYDVLNVNHKTVQDLQTVITCCFALLCLGFIFRLIGNIFMALQLPAVNDIINFAASLLSFLLIYMASRMQIAGAPLFNVAIIFSGVPMVVYLCACVITFALKADLRPTYRAIKRKHIRPIFSLGLKFFMLQIAVIIVFMTSNLIISHQFGPEEVTPYNIAFKYMSILTVGFTILLTPFWTAVTDAIARKDFKWLRKTLKVLNLCWVISCLCCIVLVLISNTVYLLWIGSEPKIPITLTALCGIYACILNWNNVYAYILNGTGKLMLSISLAVIQAIIFIPLSILLSNQWGLNGIPAALTLTLLFSSVLPVIQTRKIISGTAFGIWNH